jgi:hypothetical protein
VVTKLSDYWYKVTVKSEGAVHLRTIVTAEEKPAPPTGETNPGNVDCKLCAQVCPNCKVKPGPRCNCRLVPVPNSGLITASILVVMGALFAARRRRSRDKVS